MSKLIIDLIKEYNLKGCERCGEFLAEYRIDPYTKESKGIDHLVVIGDDDSRDLEVEEILDGFNLQETIDLLNNSK